MTKSLLQRLYDSEINFQITIFWGGGFNVGLGDAMNGWKDAANCDTWEAAEKWLTDMALKHYPESVFAKEWPNRSINQTMRFTAIGKVHPESLLIHANQLFRLDLSGPWIDDARGFHEILKECGDLFAGTSKRSYEEFVSITDHGILQPEVDRRRAEAKFVETGPTHDSGELPRR